MKNSFHLYSSCDVRMAEIKLTDHVQVKQTSAGIDTAHSFGEGKSWAQINTCSIILEVNS